MRAFPLLFAILLAAAPTRDAFAQETDWYLVKLAGTPAGWMRETRADSAGLIRTRSTMFLAINRLGSQVVMRTDVVSVETAGGALRSLDIETQMSEQRVLTTVVVNGDTARIGMTAGGRRFDRDVALRDTLLGPDAARRLTAGRLLRPRDSIAYFTWDGQLNAPVTVTRTVSARDSLVTILERNSGSPVLSTYRVDASGRVLSTQLELPFGRLEVMLADSATAIRGAAGGSLGGEAYARTLVRTGIRLPRAREIDRLRVRLESPVMASAAASLEGPGQRILSRDDHSLVLEITRRRASAPVGFPVPPTPALREYLEPNAYVQSDDPRLVALASRVAGERGTNVVAAALALQRWVSDSMRFDLGIAFAPSVEVFERRRGTCVAYATLLATLARAVGIPSRVAMGYVYVNGVFGGHAWTEVFTGREWIAVDGAVPANGPSDAARFAFAWSSLAGGPGSLTSGAAVQLYNDLRATVERYEIAGVPRDVPPGARPWLVEGDRYRNEWLGLEVVKPQGFEFVQLDETWPSATVVGMRRGDEVVRVQHRLLRPGQAPQSDALVVGTDVYEVEVESPNVRSLRETVRRGMQAFVAKH